MPYLIRYAVVVVVVVVVVVAAAAVVGAVLLGFSMQVSYPTPPCIIPPLQLVLTKADMVTPQSLTRVLHNTAAVACNKKHRACLPVIHVTSAKEGLGIQELRDVVASVLMDL